MITFLHHPLTHAYWKMPGGKRLLCLNTTENIISLPQTAPVGLPILQHGQSAILRWGHSNKTIIHVLVKDQKQHSVRRVLSYCQYPAKKTGSFSWPTAGTKPNWKTPAIYGFLST